MHAKFEVPAPADGEKIKEWQANVRHAYAGRTKAGAVARIRYDPRAEADDACVIPDSMSGSALSKKGGVWLDGYLGLWSAQFEMSGILAKAQNGATPAGSSGKNPLRSIKECTRQMRADGYEPGVVLLTRGDEGKIGETDPDVIGTAVIKVDGSAIPIMWVHENRLEATLVIDPDCIEVAYKAEGEAGRLRLDVQGPGTDKITMTATVPMSVRILDRGGVAKLAPG